MNPKHVLIVDDEPNVALVLSDSLKKLGNNYVFETAYNGEEALRKIQQTFYTLLITDYSMPGMTGLDLAQAVRQISPATQVVLMTGYGNDSLREVVGGMKFDGYIDKPFTVHQIRDIVKQAVDRASAVREEADPFRSGKQVLDQSIEEHLKLLRSHTGARCVLLISSGGYSVNVVGETASLDIVSVGALVAANFMAAAELAKLLGGRSVFKSSYHEGDDYNIYAYKVTDELLLVVIFGSESKPGMVWFYTKQTAATLIPLVAEQTSRLTLPANLKAVMDAEFDQLFDFGQDNGDGGYSTGHNSSEPVNLKLDMTELMPLQLGSEATTDNMLSFNRPISAKKRHL